MPFAAGWMDGWMNGWLTVGCWMLVSPIFQQLGAMLYDGSDFASAKWKTGHRAISAESILTRSTSAPPSDPYAYSMVLSPWRPFL